MLRKAEVASSSQVCFPTFSYSLLKSSAEIEIEVTIAFLCERGCFKSWNRNLDFDCISVWERLLQELKLKSRVRLHFCLTTVHSNVKIEIESSDHRSAIEAQNWNRTLIAHISEIWPTHFMKWRGGGGESCNGGGILKRLSDLLHRNPAVASNRSRDGVEFVVTQHTRFGRLNTPDLEDSTRPIWKTQHPRFGRLNNPDLEYLSSFDFTLSFDFGLRLRRFVERQRARHGALDAFDCCADV